MKSKRDFTGIAVLFLFSIFAAVMLSVTTDVHALKYPHSPDNLTSPIDCSNCHQTPYNKFRTITSFNTLCINANGCHAVGKSAAKKALKTNDASNRFGNLPAIGGAKNSSHGWHIPNANSNAGVTNQWAPSSEFGGWGALMGKINCTRCHRAHGDGINLTIYDKLLKADPKADHICFQCHSARRVGAGSARSALQSDKHYSHPVEVNYSSIQAAKPDLFEKVPLNPYPSNPSAELRLYTTSGGTPRAVICSTCHGPIHSSDSNPYTFDNLTSYSKTGNYSTSEGNLLRRYPATKTNDLCSSCHTVTAHKGFLCARCHAPHKKSGESNLYLIQETISTPNSFKRAVQFISTSKMADRWIADGAGDGKSNAVCQVCHTTTKYHRNYSTNQASRSHNFLSGDKFKACIQCHPHTGAFAPTCITCHGYPPEGTKSILGGISTTGSPKATASGAPSAGSHKKHIDKMGAGICSRCHSGGMADTGSVDGNITLKFNAFYSYTGASQKYSGTSAVRTGYYGYSGTGIKTSGTINTQRCESMKCHGGGGWLTKSYGNVTSPYWYTASSVKCGACHGAKKSSGAQTYNTWPTTYAHPTHAGTGTGQMDLMCKQCHTNTVLSTATSLSYAYNAHVNGQADVAFDTAGGKATGKSGYTGDTAINSGFGSCLNLYCHSKGTSFAGFSTTSHFANFTAKWTDAGQRGSYKKAAGQKAKCNYCHGNKSYSGITSAMPNYAGGSPKANSHAIHVVQNGYVCNNCHYGTARNNTGISNRSIHANIFYNISLATNRSLGSGLKRYSSVYNGSGGTCMNNNCHTKAGGTIVGKPVWGSGYGCPTCHMNNASAVKDVDNFTYGDSTKAEIYSSEWVKRGHGRSSGTYPFSGNNGANKSCGDCHKSSVSHNQANYFRLYTSNPDRLCMSCHGSVGQLGSWGFAYGNRTGIQGHSWSNMSTAGYKGGSNLNGKAGWNFTPKCIDCHDPHGDKNNKMVHAYVNFSGSDSVGRPNGYNPNAGSIMNYTAVRGGTQINWSSFVNGNRNGICQRCHSAEVQNFAKDKFTATHNTGYRCIECHSHNVGFAPSESPGGLRCGGCHTLYNKMRDPNTYHHVLNSDAATYTTKTSFSGVFSDFTSTSRRCLMCHVDHDVFSPAKNPYGKGQRAKNLRVNARVAGDGNNTNTFINTDFWPARRNNLQRTGTDAGTGNYSSTRPIMGPSGYYGVCMTCHKNIQSKNTTLQTGDNMQYARTLPGNPVGIYTSSSHNYQIITGMSRFSDGSKFRANCSKCHSSKIMDKGAQSQAKKKFGLHDSKYMSLLNTTGVEGMPDLTDYEMLCYKCHSKTTRAQGGPGGVYDFYSSVKMRASAKGIRDAIEAKSSGHPIEDPDMAGRHRPDEQYRVTKSYQFSRTGGVQGGPGSGWNRDPDRHVACVDCHNTHGGKATLIRSLATDGISGAQAGVWGVKVKYSGAGQPTYSTVSQVTKVYEVCLKCHSAFAYYTHYPIDPTGGPALGTGTLGSWDYDAVETDVGMDFNPSAHGYHPVMAQGRNQPNWDTVARGGGGTGSVALRTNTWNPNWPNTATGFPFANRTTQLYQDQLSGEVKRIRRFGLDWAFVPPFGTSARVTCVDCHRSDNTNNAEAHVDAFSVISQTGWSLPNGIDDIKEHDDGFGAVPTNGGSSTQLLKAYVKMSTPIGEPAIIEAQAIIYGRSSSWSRWGRTVYVSAWNNAIVDSNVNNWRVRFARGNMRFSRTLTTLPTWADLSSGSVWSVGVWKHNTTDLSLMSVDYLGLGVVYLAPADVRGPHGSLQKWILTDVDKHIRYDANLDGDLNDIVDAPNSYVPNTTPVDIRGAWPPTYYGAYGNGKDKYLRVIFCFNCHRRDVYDNSSDNWGDTNTGPASNNYVNNYFGRYSRNPHPLEGINHPASSTQYDNWMGIWCTNCHGGRTFEAVTAPANRRDLLVRKNEFHGSFANRTVYTTDGTTPINRGLISRPRGVRLLHGAALVGINLPGGSATVDATCYTADVEDSMTRCSQHNGGGANRTLEMNYDYTSW